MTIKITVHENKPPIEVCDIADMEEIISSAAKEAQTEGVLNILFMEAHNGNNFYLVVGSDETVLGFVYGHLNPPYYESQGVNEADKLVMTAYASFRHHTVFSRKSVISAEEGLLAAQEFYETGDLPKCVRWIEV